MATSSRTIHWSLDNALLLIISSRQYQLTLKGKCTIKNLKMTILGIAVLLCISNNISWFLFNMVCFLGLLKVNISHLQSMQRLFDKALNRSVSHDNKCDEISVQNDLNPFAG